MAVMGGVPSGADLLAVTRCTLTREYDHQVRMASQKSAKVIAGKVVCKPILSTSKTSNNNGLGSYPIPDAHT